jgi:hypothetical protein
MLHNSVLFGINQSSKSVYNFKPTEKQFLGSLDAMFNGLKGDSKISEADVKDRRLSLRVFAYEAQSVSFCEHRPAHLLIE